MAAGRYFFNVSFPANKRNTQEKSINVKMIHLLLFLLKLTSPLMDDLIYRMVQGKNNYTGKGNVVIRSE